MALLYVGGGIKRGADAAGRPLTLDAHAHYSMWLELRGLVQTSPASMLCHLSLLVLAAPAIGRVSHFKSCASQVEDGIMFSRARLSGQPGSELAPRQDVDTSQGERSVKRDRKDKRETSPKRAKEQKKGKEQQATCSLRLLELSASAFVSLSLSLSLYIYINVCIHRYVHVYI